MDWFVARLRFWGLFECTFYVRYSKTGNDGAVRLLVCCLVEGSKERKLESLKTYTFFFLGGGRGRKWGERKLYFILGPLSVPHLSTVRSAQALVTKQRGSQRRSVPDIHVTPRVPLPHRPTDVDATTRGHRKLTFKFRVNAFQKLQKKAHKSRATTFFYRAA